MTWVAAGNVEVASGEGGSDDEGGGLDAVGDDAATGSVELLDTLNLDRRSACPFNVCTHFVQEIGEVYDFGLARAVFEDGFALSQRGSHHDVFGAGDGDLVEGV